MTTQLVAARFDAIARTIHLQVAKSSGELVNGTVTISDHDGIVAFEGLAEFKERIGGERLDVDTNLNKLCSSVLRGQLHEFPVDLEWPETERSD